MTRTRVSIRLASAAMLAALAACGGGGDDTPTPTGTPPPTATPTSAAPPPTAATPTTPVGDAVAGKALWNTKVTGVGLSCADCHGLPTDDVNNVLNGAAGYEVIAGAIQRNGASMTVFQGRLSVQQMQDLSAYLKNPTR
jgi:mono/diheme cytochrome c family protein